MKIFLHIINTLKVGDRIIVPKSGVRMIQHHAIYLGYWSNHHWFIENKESIGVRLITAEVLLLDVDMITRILHFSPTPGYSRTDLYNYALSKRGKSYNLINYNCEHLANDIQHKVAKSKQANTGIGIAVIGLAALLIGGLTNSGYKQNK
jgi:hypothetical protein